MAPVCNFSSCNMHITVALCKQKNKQYSVAPQDIVSTDCHLNETCDYSTFDILSIKSPPLFVFRIILGLLVPVTAQLTLLEHFLPYWHVDVCFEFLFKFNKTKNVIVQQNL